MKSTRKKLFAVLLSAALLLSSMTVFAAGDNVAKVGETEYATLQDAINAASNGQEVVLIADTKEDIVIDAGKTVTLNLGECTLTNESDHTITNKGTLTITGSGTVDNVTHQKAAIQNEPGAKVTLNGGNYTRSLENGISSTNNGGNSYYALVNHGTMEINSGVTVTQKGQFSSMIENGWYNGNQNTTGEESVLTINGGTFSGGLNTIKNDDYGNLTINDGTFNNVAQAAVLNWNVAKITEGTFNSESTVILNGKIDNDAKMDKGQLTIIGGTFTGAGDAVAQMHSGYSFGEISISGGTFDVNGALIAATGNDGTVTITGGDFQSETGIMTKNNNSTATLTITGGTFDKDPKDYIPEDEKLGVFVDNDGNQHVGRIATITIEVTIDGKTERESVELLAGSVIDEVELNKELESEFSKPEYSELNKTYKFAGWYADAAYTQKFDFAKSIDSDLTIYMKWDKIKDSSTEDPVTPPDKTDQPTTKPDISKNQTTNTSVNQKTKAPRTGDTSQAGAYLLLAVLALGAGGFAVKRKISK